MTGTLDAIARVRESLTLLSESVHSIANATRSTVNNPKWRRHPDTAHMAKMLEVYETWAGGIDVIIGGLPDIASLSNQGEGAWIAFADRWPGESVALDDPSVKTRDTVLVTNGINARDRMGRQTNVWLAAPIQSANEVVAFTDSNQKIHGLTHWKPAFGQAEADRRDAERLDWLDAQRNDDVSVDSDGERTLIGCWWNVGGQHMDVRSAIDAAIAATQEQT